MLTLIWNISTAIRGYLRSYLPSNIAIDLLRSPRGLKWTLPAALAALFIYLYAMSICATVVATGGPAWVNVLVILFFWNASKFASIAVVGPLLWVGNLKSGGRRRRTRVSSPSNR